MTIGALPDLAPVLEGGKEGQGGQHIRDISDRCDTDDTSRLLAGNRAGGRAAGGVQRWVRAAGAAARRRAGTARGPGQAGGGGNRAWGDHCARGAARGGDGGRPRDATLWGD